LAGKVTLLIGGLAKAGSWDPLLKILAQEKGHLREILCFGQDGPLLANHCREAGVAHACFGTLREAVMHVSTAMEEGEVVLLSPGCASFDEFRDFEERGNMFKSLVEEINLAPMIFVKKSLAMAGRAKSWRSQVLPQKIKNPV